MPRDLPTAANGTDYLAGSAGLTLDELGPAPDFTWTDDTLAREYAEAVETGETYTWATGNELLPEYTQHARG